MAPDATFDSALKVFKQWDVSNNGFISQEDFTQIMRSLGLRDFSTSDCFAGVDANGDGGIDYQEFLAWLYGSAPQAVKDYVELHHFDTKSLLRGLVARLLPVSTSEDPIGFLGDLLDAVARELRKLPPGGLLHAAQQATDALSKDAVKAEHAEACSDTSPRIDVSESSATWKEKQLIVNDMSGLEICKINVESSSTMVQMMESIEKAAAIPVPGQQLFLNVDWALDSILIDMLAPLDELLAPLEGSSDPSLVLIRRGAEHAGWMEKALRYGCSRMMKAPPEVKSDPAIALAVLQVAGLHYDSLKSLCSVQEVTADDDSSPRSDLSNSSRSSFAGTAGLTLPDTLRTSRTFILAAVQCRVDDALGFRPLKFLVDSAAPEIQKDMEVLLAVLQNSNSSGNSNTLDRAFLKELLALQGTLDRNVALKLVQRGAAWVITVLPLTLQRDREFLQAAIEKDAAVLEYFQYTEEAVPRDLALAAVKKNGLVLQYLCHTHRADREIAIAAVSSKGRAIRYLSQSLRMDRDVILQAVKQDAAALEDLDGGANSSDDEDQNQEASLRDSLRKALLRDVSLWRSVAASMGTVLATKTASGEHPEELIVAASNSRILYNCNALETRDMKLLRIRVRPTTQGHASSSVSSYSSASCTAPVPGRRLRSLRPMQPKRPREARYLPDFTNPFRSESESDDSYSVASSRITE